MAMLNNQRVIKANPFLWEQLQTIPWFIDLVSLPSGKLTKSYGKSPSLKGKSTTNVPFSIAMYVQLPEGK
jgi:hypothetical protein